MEKVVHLQLHEYLFSNSIIYSRQSAYSHDDSTALQLAALVHQTSENLDNGQETRTWTFPKHLIKPGIRASYSSYNNVALRVHALNGLKVI